MKTSGKIFMSRVSPITRLQLILYLKRLVLMQKRAMRIISKFCYDAHTEPIFKNLCILPLNDIYLAEKGK